MKRRGSGASTVPFAPGGARIRTVLPQLPVLARPRADNPKAWDELMSELDADFA
jgi:hypothetical protein